MELMIELTVVIIFYVLSFLFCKGKCSAFLGGVRSIKDEEKKIKMTKLCGKAMLLLTTFILIIVILDNIGVI